MSVRLTVWIIGAETLALRANNCATRSRSLAAIPIWWRGTCDTEIRLVELSPGYFFACSVDHRLGKSIDDVVAEDLPSNVHVVYESHSDQPHIHFTSGSSISLLYLTENDSSAEIATVGNGSLVGISLLINCGDIANPGFDRRVNSTIAMAPA